MKNFIKRHQSKAVTWLPVVAMVGIICLAFAFRDYFSLELLLSRSPKEPALAFLFLLALFGLKSFSVVFPLFVLYALGGLLFSWSWGMLANLAGVVVCLTLPYVLGRLCGGQLIADLMKKYPKMEKIEEFQEQNAWFLSFFLRILGFLPGDVVSMYLGACHIPYVSYLVGGCLGMAPGIVVGTILGETVTDPTSPVFWGSLLGMGALSIASLLGYVLYQKKKKRQ